MQRRSFLQLLGAGASLAVLPRAARATAAFGNCVILVELEGGNDGINTVIPYADAQYAVLRPKLAIPRDQVLQLDEHVGLHPSLAPLHGLWKGGELAVVEGLGYDKPNLSHFRSIEIWDTASRSDEVIERGWLARLFAENAPPAKLAAHAAVVGAPELGPFAGDWRVLAIDDTDRFTRGAKGVQPPSAHGNAALSHILDVEREIAHAAQSLGEPRAFATKFPQGSFGKACKTAAEIACSPTGVAAIRITLSGFDTHHGQLGAHARVLGELASGLTALRGALIEAQRWSSTLVVTYAEFGRRAKENESQGTDHGTSNTHFALGGGVRGGLYGARASLDRLDGNGNVLHNVDFRSLYATIARHWNVTAPMLDGARPIDLLKT